MVLVAATLLPVLVFAGAVIVEQARNERAELERRSEEIAAATNRLIDAHVLATEQALRVLAGLVPEAADGRAEFHRHAAETAARLGKAIVLLDRDGRHLVSTRAGADTGPPGRTDMAPLASAFAADRLVVTDLIGGTSTSGPVALVAVPVRRSGRTDMVLAAHMPPTDLDDVLREAGLPQPWIAAVVDRQGIFVARSHEPEIFLGTPARPELVAAAAGERMEGRFDNVTWEGVAQTNAFRRSAVTGWTAVIGIPHEVIAAPQRRAWALLATGAAFAGLALALAAFFANRIARPVRALQGAALALAHGEPPPPEPPRIRELVEVRQAFETAAAIVRERNAAQAELERTTALLAAVSASTPDLIYAKDRESRILIANEAVLAVIGKPLDAVKGSNDFYGDPAQAAAIRANDRAVMESGETQKLEETFTSPDGTTRVFLSTKSPMRDASGAVVGLVGVSTDITARKRREEHVELLMHELSHRTKNLLAVIQALARQLMRASSDPADFEQKFMARIQALARAHDLLVQQHWQGAQLADVVGAQLYPFVGGEGDRGRVALDGPPLMLRLEAVQNLSLVLHELATNASKYGALSVPTGTIAIAWRIDGDALVFEWREAGGPPVTPPTRRGFGHTIIERMLAQGLESEVSLEYPPEGARATLRIPRAQVATDTT